MISVGLRWGSGGEPGVDLLANEVNAKGDKGDAEARGGVAKLVGEHRVLPPFVPSPEELSRRS